MKSDVGKFRDLINLLKEQKEGLAAKIEKRSAELADLEQQTDAAQLEVSRPRHCLAHRLLATVVDGSCLFFHVPRRRRSCRPWWIGKRSRLKTCSG
jgi:hypothetical protein